MNLHWDWHNCPGGLEFRLRIRPFVDPVASERIWIVEKSTLTIYEAYGVNFLFNPAAFDEGFNKDPLYANDPAAQNRGPWIKVFDNRADAP